MSAPSPAKRRTVDHTSKSELIALRAFLDRLPLVAKATVAMRCIDVGLMGAPFFVRACLWLMKWRFGSRGPCVLAAVLVRRYPDIAEGAWAETMEHLVNGHDRGDPASAGGFDACELLTFLRLVQLEES